MALLDTLDVGSGGGSFNPIFKYNATAGRAYFKDAEGEKEIEKPTFVCDLYNTATGWAAFRAKEAPVRVFDPEPGVRAEKTDESQKRCLMVLCYATESFEGVAELCTTSMHMLNALSDLYAEFRTVAEKNNDGKLPVVKLTGVTEMKDKFGTNYRPNFEIVDWVDRPADLPDAHPAPDLIASVANNTPAPAAHVAPPKAASANGSRPVF